MKPLSAWLDAHAAISPERIMLTIAGANITYGEMALKARHLAAFLMPEARLEKGARIAWLGYNRAEFITLIFAAARAGLTVVPLNWRLSAQEQKNILENAGASLLLAQAEFASRAADICPAGCRLMTCGGSSDAHGDFDDALHAGKGLPCPVRGGPDDPLLLVYTSGTTGEPKGAVLSQEAILFNALNAIHMHDMTRNDTILSILPLFHVGGLNIQTMPAFYCGARVILHEKFAPAAALACIAQERPSLTLQVPATLQAMMSLDEWESSDISGLRALAIGSTDVPLPLIEAVQARNVPVIQIYGATETGPVAIYQTPAEAMATTGSIGREGLHTQIRLVDEAGKDTQDGETGEILVRGRHVAQGYWKDAANPAFAGGWFHSGDMARRDSNGLFWFRGRKKNMIISGGENIYPAEIERVLRQLSGIAACAVVGIPDEKWGQAPAALVVLDEPPSISLADIHQVLDESLARYKHPRHIFFVPELPRNAMGKVLLEDVRAIILSRLGKA